MLQRGFIKTEDQEPGLVGLEFYIDAFRELSSCRPGGMDLQPIPFTAIAEYFRIYELEDFDEFASLMRAMDNTFLELSADVQKKEREKNAGGNADPKDNNQRGRAGGQSGPR